MSEKQGNEIDTDELYADLAWLLNALERDRDVASVPEVVRAAMRYIEARVHEVREAKQEREIPVAQLVSGDSVYSPSTKTWHEVRRSTAGQLYFRRDERWMPVDFAADVKFLTRRGEAGAPAGLLFDAFGGEVIEE